MTKLIGCVQHDCDHCKNNEAEIKALRKQVAELQEYEEIWKAAWQHQQAKIDDKLEIIREQECRMKEMRIEHKDRIDELEKRLELYKGEVEKVIDSLYGSYEKHAIRKQLQEILKGK